MRIRTLGVALLPWFFALASASRADTIITREGSSYSGQFLGAKAGTIGFTDTSGIGYTFPSAMCSRWSSRLQTAQTNGGGRALNRKDREGRRQCAQLRCSLLSAFSFWVASAVVDSLVSEE
jgi:hypothetical protein